MTATPHDIIRLLDETRAALLAAAEGIDPEAIVSADGRWSLRMTLAHVQHWDELAIYALEAYQRGEEFMVYDWNPQNPNAPDEYNARVMSQYQHVPVETIRESLTAARQRLVQSILRLTETEWIGSMRCPWGPLRSPDRMLNGIVHHEQEHCHEIDAYRRGKEQTR